MISWTIYQKWKNEQKDQQRADYNKRCHEQYKNAIKQPRIKSQKLDVTKEQTRV